MRKNDPATGGRRVGQSKTREQILSKAQQLFAEEGYERTTVRRVAVAAGVDPSLVIYFFKTKQQLFVEAIMPAYGPRQNIPQLLDGDVSGVGKRLATYLVNYLENPETRRLVVGLVRAAVSEPTAAEMLKQLFVDRTGVMLAAIEGVDNPELRANLAGSQFIGLVMLRYIINVEPLASAPKEVIIDTMAHTIQWYITGDWQDIVAQSS